MIPQPGQILAVHVESFIGDSIEITQQLQNIREGDFCMKKFIATHIGIVVLDRNQQLCVCEMLANGCVLTPWKGSRYETNEVRYILLDWLDWLTPYEKLLLQNWCWNDVDSKKRYDYLGIVHQLVLTISGKWIGKKGDKAQKRYYCSEQIATYCNRLRKYYTWPWRYNPQMFTEIGLKYYFKIVGLNFKIK